MMYVGLHSRTFGVNTCQNGHHLLEIILEITTLAFGFISHGMVVKLAGNCAGIVEVGT